MTVVVTRIGIPNPGKQIEALAFAEKRAKLLSDEHDANIEVLLRVGGPVGEVAMVSRHDSLAQFEERKRKVVRATMAGDFPTSEAGVFQSVEEHIWMIKDE